MRAGKVAAFTAFAFFCLKKELTLHFMCCGLVNNIRGLLISRMKPNYWNDLPEVVTCSYGCRHVHPDWLFNVPSKNGITATHALLSKVCADRSILYNCSCVFSLGTKCRSVVKAIWAEVLAVQLPHEITGISLPEWMIQGCRL